MFRKIVIHAEKSMFFGNVKTYCGISLFTKGKDCNYYLKHFITIITTKKLDKVTCLNCKHTLKYRNEMGD